MLSVIVRALVNDTSSVNDQDGPRHASTSPSVRSDGASSEAADIVSTSIDNEMEGTTSDGPLADAPDLSLVDQIAQLALDRRVLDGDSYWHPLTRHPVFSTVTTALALCEKRMKRSETWV